MAIDYIEFSSAWILPENVKASELEAYLKQWDAEHDIYREDADGLHFEWCLRDGDINTDGEAYLHVHDGNRGSSAEHAAACIARLQKKYNDSRPWFLPVACTCSAPRIGAFGGVLYKVHNGEVSVALSTFDYEEANG